MTVPADATIDDASTDESAQTTWFLIVYDNDAMKQVSMTTFADDSEACAAYERAEAEHLWDRRTEVVLLGGESEEAVRVTHSRYFHEGPFALDDFRDQMADIQNRGWEALADLYPAMRPDLEARAVAASRAGQSAGSEEEEA